MINNALTFIKKHLGAELHARIGVSEGDVVIDSINKEHSSDNLVITLINIEEEKIYKEQNHYKRSEGEVTGFQIVNPEIKLNLYILFSAQKNDYKEALKQISCLIKIFQGKYVFEKEDFAKYSEISGLESLIVELFPLSLEQNNNLWQTLGNKMVPSVMYKVKMVSIQDDKPAGESPEIRAIGIDIAHKQ